MRSAAEMYSRPHPHRARGGVWTGGMAAARGRGRTRAGRRPSRPFWEDGPMSDRPVLLVDLDGTITDSIDGIVKSLDHALASVGARWDSSRDIRSVVGPPMIDTLASLGLAGADLDRPLNPYRARSDEVRWQAHAVFA